LQKFFERAQSADAGHRDVEQHDVERATSISFETFFTSFGEIDAIALSGEQRLEHLAHDFFVVYDKDRSFSGITFFRLHHEGASLTKSRGFTRMNADHEKPF